MRDVWIITYVIIACLISPLSHSQDLQDRIILNTGDTISCEITLVNDQNIFYDFFKRKTRKSDFVPLTNVKEYDWLSKDKIKAIDKKKSYMQYDTTGRWLFGLKLTAHYNYYLWHLTPSFSIYKGNHNIFIGPEYTQNLDEEIINDPANSYETEYIGIGLGYRYIFNSNWKRTNLFIQIKFSIYKIRYIEYSQGSPPRDNYDMIFENTMGVGINYRITKNFEIYGGVGFGSTKGFLLIIDGFIPNSFVGIEYRFR